MINSPQPGMSMPKGVDDNFYTGFGTLFKHCKEIHLPGAGRFIRLGTLAEYRTNENSAIRDEEEGMFKVTLDFPNSTAMPVDILKRLTLNTANFGPGTHLDNLRIASFYFDKTCGCIQSREDVEVSNKTENQVTFSGRIDLLAEGADAFVLCLSTSADSDSVIEDTEYDSVWTLKSDCLEQFTKTMADYLIDIPAQEVVSNQTLGPLNAPGFSTPEFDADTKFCFSTEVVEVAYQSRIVAVPPNVTEEIKYQNRAKISQSQIP